LDGNSIEDYISGTPPNDVGTQQVFLAPKDVMKKEKIKQSFALADRYDLTKFAMKKKKP